jgi:hypothetical protein
MGSISSGHLLRLNLECVSLDKGGRRSSPLCSDSQLKGQLQQCPVGMVPGQVTVPLAPSRVMIPPFPSHCSSITWSAQQHSCCPFAHHL